MKSVFLIGAAIFLFAGSFSINVNAKNECDSVLIPTVEGKSDKYFSIESYSYEYAEKIYDELQKKSDKDLQTNAFYERFKAEYKESKTKEQFSKKVRETLSKENWTNFKDILNTSYRIGLEKDQIEAWGKCSANYEAAQLLLTASGIRATDVNTSNEPFSLNVFWKPQRGVPEGILTIKLDGAKFENGQTTNKINMKGFGDKNMFVYPKSNTKRVRIIAEIENRTDFIMIPLKLPIKNTEKAIKELGETENYFGDGVAVDCQCSEESGSRGECRTNVWLNNFNILTSSQSSPQYAITFGSWVNGTCNWQGNGWNRFIGTCKGNAGSGLQRCKKVKILYDKITFTEV